MPASVALASQTNTAVCYQTKDSIVTRNIAGETWLIPITGQLADLEQLYHLNDAGAFIWNCLDGKTTLEKISQKLTNNYAVSSEQAVEDVAVQISELLEAGLLDEGTQNGQ